MRPYATSDDGYMARFMQVALSVCIDEALSYYSVCIDEVLS
jgi:hypothetical protein